MLKQAKAQQSLLLKVPQRGLRKYRLTLHPESSDVRRAEMYNVYGVSEHNLGVIKMNREHRYNTLTPQLIDDIIRGVDTMNGDSFRHAIYLTTDKHEHWSNGTDFRTIAHMKKEDQFGRIQEYMRQIYYLQTHMAEINKPLIAVASGHAKNSGASFLAACAHPMTTHDCRISFNEATFGFVPHAGASFYMSRMKGEFGTFMALTGLQIQGTEATRLDLTRGTVYDPKNFEMEVSDQVSQLPWPLYGGNEQFKPHHDEAFHSTPWQHAQENRDIMRKQFLLKEGNRYLTDARLGDVGLIEEPEDRWKSGVAEANLNYMKQIRQDSMNKEPDNDVGYLEFGEGIDNSRKFMYKNYFDEVLGAITSQIGNSTTQIDGSAVNQQQLIDRCFLSNSVPEIMENLRKESHPFAARCLEAMKRNSPQSMQLALIMLRKAQNLCYKGCLQMELNVAFNRMQDADFDLGVKAILGSPKKEGELYHRTPKWAPLLKDNQLQLYFEENKFAKGIDLQVVENALMPTKNYYKKYSDQVRLWLNQTTATQEVIRECFDQEARQALQEQGIDVRDLALTPEIARNHLAAKLAQERVELVYSERAEQLMTDDQVRQNYFDKIQLYVQKLEQSDDAFYSQVNKDVAGVFQNACFTRLDSIHRKSKEAHQLEKRRMFIRLKKYYFKNRILQYNEERYQISQKQADALPFKQMHLTEKWDECFRDVQHPELQKSPLYYISKALGRVSLTAPEMAKAWLTNPENRSMMTTITIDKDELDRINTDLLQNPEKYEMIFTMQDYAPGTFEDRDVRSMVKRQRALDQAKMDEHEYWFRLLNEGRCPIDTLPYAQEFNAYRGWADLIQYNATNQLRTVINKLLIDHENAKNFSGSLKSLFSKVNQSFTPSKSKKNTKNLPMMGQSTRPAEEIRKSITRMLRNDKHLSYIYSDDKLHNSLIHNLKQECEAELLRLVEIVLIDKRSELSKHEFEERLAQLTNPQGSIGMSLNIIDQHLHQVNGEALVKDAFTIVAPFYSDFMLKRLTHEAEETMAKLNFGELEPLVMLFYWLNREFPMINKNPVLHKFLNYSFDKDMYDLAEAKFPFLTKRFQQSDLASVLGGEDLVAKRSASIKELKHDSLEQTRAQMKFYDETMATLKTEQVFEKSSEEAKDKFWTLTPYESRELNQIQQSIIEIEEFLYSIKYEIDNHMTDLDLLKWFVESVEKFNLDVNMMQSTIDPNWQNKQSYHEQLTDYAKFIHHFAKGLVLTQQEHRFEGIKFLEQFDQIPTLQQKSFYQSARQERDFVYREHAQTVTFDRHAVIKRQIESFNDLQEQHLSHKQHQENLMQLIDSLPNKEELRQFMQTSDLLDYNKLYRRIADKDFKFLTSPGSVVDESKAVKAANKQISRLDSAVDVTSLQLLKKTLADDVLLSREHRNNLYTIIEYIQEQTKYMSNAERKQITVKDYLSKYHHQSHAAYTQYSSDLLKHKLEQVLGKSEQQPDMIDWSVGDIRTMPNEHTMPNKMAFASQHHRIMQIHPEIVAKLKSHDYEDFVKEAAVMQGAVYYGKDEAPTFESQEETKEDEDFGELSPEEKKKRAEAKFEWRKYIPDKYKFTPEMTKEQKEKIVNLYKSGVIERISKSLMAKEKLRQNELIQNEKLEEKQLKQSLNEELLEDQKQKAQLRKLKKANAVTQESVKYDDPALLTKAAYDYYVYSLRDLDKRNEFIQMYGAANRKQRDRVDNDILAFMYEDILESVVQDQSKLNPEGKVKARDNLTGLDLEYDTVREYVNRLIYREARDACELPLLMVPTKNLYENQVLIAMLEPDFHNDVVKTVDKYIEEWFNIRLNGMMLNKSWADAVNKDIGHLYLKVLREQVVSELGLGESPVGHELSYDHIMADNRTTQHYDIENKYNMDHLNNEHAIGFDHLVERARATNPEDLHKATHGGVFEKLLSDYFLQKRGEYKDANKMFTDLVKIFEDKNAAGLSPIGSLENTLMRQNYGVETHQTATIAQTNFRDLINLDVITSRAMQRCKNGLSDRLRQLSITELDHPDWHTTQVPEYFELFDARKPAEMYVNDKLMMVVEECFEVRAQLEKRLTRAELSAFDKVLARYLQKDKLMPRLKAAIDQDYNALNQGKSLVNSMKDYQKFDEEVQLMKTQHEQRDRNKKIVDEDAHIKELAFDTMTEMRNNEESKKGFESLVKSMFVGDNFEEYYKKQLRLDAQKPPRPINPEDFKGRKPWDRPVGAPFKPREERVLDLKEDHALYQEKKLEQQDRIRLFYILEQFYEQARTKPDPASRGQQVISEYFSVPENTFFFDKNKIV